MSSNKQKIDQINKRLSSSSLAAFEESVKAILLKVKMQGDKAVQEFSKRYDDYIGPVKVELGTKEEPKYLNQISDELKSSLELAYKRVEEFHKYDLARFADWSFDSELGERLGVKYTALDSVAVYVPGGQAPLVSTVLMTALPAKVAGVRRVVMFSPPPICSEMLAAAELAGVDEVYAIGGAQAVAVAAYGTETVQSVDKIVGPGNVFVSIAKKEVFGTIGIDGIYGPSELAIVADSSAKAKNLAWDLLSQLEHGSGLESVLLVSTDEILNKQVDKELNTILDELLAKGLKTDEQIKTINNSYSKWSALITVEDLKEAAELINHYAPEHLELIVEDAELEALIADIKHAGAIFVGANSCESLGDYLAGPSHCLPTGGTARFSSGLQCSDFLKKSSIVDFSNVKAKDVEFKSLITDVARIARAEQLEAHARAMEVRGE